MNVFILSVTSDIGKYLNKRFKEEGHSVIGTSRNFGDEFYCDLNDPFSHVDVIEKLPYGYKWDLFISCVGQLTPIKPFFQAKFSEWRESFGVNSIEQLRILHSLYPFRNENAKAVFFAGGKVNGILNNYSAYSVSKINLIKMVEQISEESDLHISCIGPGFVNTKIHKETFNSEFGNKENTLKAEFTDPELIYKCIKSVIKDPVKSGMNISIKDDWDKPFKDKDQYKLRRYVNEELLPP